nr:zf-TFIIB domain-containing protein [Spiractinospora alimapuensis]
MTCPKCQGLMQTFDRQGVHIDRCQSCGGVFLDRGELEQLVSAEQRHYGAPPPDPHAPPPPGPPPRAAGTTRVYAYPDSPRPYGHYPDSPPPYGHRRRRRGFLESLFD